ncbi:MAG: hypothetical protein AB7T49_18070 [Oligoflexales bacterium]
MKNILIGISAMAVIASQGFANDRDLAFKATKAGFVAESAEHSLRLLYFTSPSLKDAVLGATVEITDQDRSRVMVSLDGADSLEFDCIQFDDTSHSGTVIKMEVRCTAN